MQGPNGFKSRPIVPNMGSTNIGSPDSLVQIQFQSNTIQVVTHLDKGKDGIPYHNTITFDYKGRVSD